MENFPSLRELESTHEQSNPVDGESVQQVATPLASEEQSEEQESKMPTVASNPRLSVNLESENFLSKYMRYAETTSDAYPEYHYALGLTLLSVAVDRNVVVALKHGDIYPNMWVFCIGDSTVSRKTTAFKLGQFHIKKVYPKKALPSSFSPEALMEAISANPKCYYLKDEAGGLLAALRKDYMAETRDFLAEIYECGDYYRKLKTDETTIKEPYISQLLMTTPDNLKEYSTTLDLTSGWLLRYLWIYPNYLKKWKPFTEKTKEDFERAEIIDKEYSIVMSKLTKPRQLRMSTEAMNYFQGWQKSIEDDAVRSENSIVKALAGRLMTYAIKLAALFTVGSESYSETSEISLQHIQEACRQVTEYFLPIGCIIVEEVAHAESKNKQDRILGVIKRNGGQIKHRDLLRTLHMNIRDVNDGIEVLEESEEIKTKIVEGGKKLYILLSRKDTARPQCAAA